jgi:hypothetical protein
MLKMENPSRRAVLAGISVAAAPMVVAVDKSLGAVALSDDPIFAAIAAHKAAERAFSDILHEQSRLEGALPKSLRQSEITSFGEEIAPTDDPRWIANQRAVNEAGDEVYRVALTLLDIQPTTAAGMVSLFRYVADADESSFPCSVLWDDQDDSEKGVDFSSALLLAAADWIESSDAPGAA